MMDEKLKKYTCQRIQWVVQNPDKDTIMAMKPYLKNPDGTDILCNCGLVYAEDGMQQEGCATLYTHVGTVSLNYFSVKCPNEQCEISFKEIAKEAGIFFFSQQTCAADEIGWDFISSVKSSKISFTGFCNQMSLIYKMAVSNLVGKFILFFSVMSSDR